MRKTFGIAALLTVALLTSAASAAERDWHRSWKNPVNRNLYRIAVCETGGINNGKPLWTHHTRDYGGALGFRHSTWAAYRLPGMPLNAWEASPGEQYAVARVLVRRWPNYSSWPACSIRLGLR